MIKVFFHFLSDTCITYADGIPEIIIEAFLNRCSVIFLKCPAKAFQFFGVLDRLLPKPLPNLLYKYPADLPVWNDKFCQIARLSTALRQISRREQNAPKVINAGVQISVCQLLTYHLFHTPAVYQQFKLVAGRGVCLAHKTPDDIIAACVYPVILRAHRRLHFERMTITYHIPWAVNVQCPKTIPVIPLLYNIVFLHETIVFQHLSNFCICEAKGFMILNILYGIYIEIIEPRENTLP